MSKSKIETSSKTKTEMGAAARVTTAPGPVLSCIHRLIEMVLLAQLEEFAKKNLSRLFSSHLCVIAGLVESTKPIASVLWPWIIPTLTLVTTLTYTLSVNWALTYALSLTSVQH